jgi:hypothetical protein
MHADRQIQVSGGMVKAKQALVAEQLIPRHPLQHHCSGADFGRALDLFYRFFDVADRH